MVRFALLALVAAVCDLASAHTVITYPGDGTGRGNNIYANDTAALSDPASVGVEFSNGTIGYPYGMQFQFPCGGLPLSTNRTKWPYTGGALSIQPGWGGGHASAFMYINLGIAAPNSTTGVPVNFTLPMLPPFAITGPSNAQYTSQFCLPQVPMPAGLSPQIGDLVTIQVVELLKTGAALYSCVDLELVDPLGGEVELVDSYNCYNSSGISLSLVFTSAALTTSAALQQVSLPSVLAWSAPLAMALAAFAWL